MPNFVQSGQDSVPRREEFPIRVCRAGIGLVISELKMLQGPILDTRRTNELPNLYPCIKFIRKPPYTFLRVWNIDRFPLKLSALSNGIEGSLFQILIRPTGPHVTVFVGAGIQKKHNHIIGSETNASFTLEDVN